MKRIIVILVLTLGSAALPPGASATQPFFNPLMPEPDFVDTTTCGFPVEVSTVVEESVAKIFSDGSVIITGKSRKGFTNLDNGKSLETVASGPAFLTPHADGTTTVRLEGVHNPGLPAGFLYPGSPGILWNIAGTIVAQLDANGALVGATTFRVTVLHDICAELT